MKSTRKIRQQNEEVKERVAQDIPAIPPGRPDFSANLGRFMTFCQTCSDKEKEIRQVVNISARINVGRRMHQPQVARAPTAGRAFFTGNAPFEQSPFDEGQFGSFQAPARYQQTRQQKEPGPSNKNITFFNEVITVPMTMTSEMEIAYITCLSTAEQALAEASGTVKPITCFGCDKDGHAFRECPQKHDKETLQSFFKNIREWKERMRAKRQAAMGQYSPSNEEARRRGFMNARIQGKILKATREDMDTKERTELITSLAKDIRNAKGPESGRIILTAGSLGSFIGYAVTSLNRKAEAKKTSGTITHTGTTFAAIEQVNDQVEFSINSLLPFIDFPIGKDAYNQAMLKGLYDTG
jgi:hypothetical protein